MNSIISMTHEKLLEDTIMEMKETFMVSPSGHSEPIFRIAHFLKPIANSTHELIFQHNPSSSSSVSEPKELSFKIHFNGWQYPHLKWVRWVDKLKLKYESLWKKFGIFEAIMSTKSRIKKNQDLVKGAVEKWCCETNTFVFPFGEATITLEDVMVLGGYSLFGHPVFTKLEDQEMREVETKLILAIKKLRKCNYGLARTSTWMDIFIDKGSEIEHEAFLATWLSIFVFPQKNLLVNISIFPIAIHLAKGKQIALAPAILASLYNDLSLFNKTIVDLKKYPSEVGDKFPFELEVTLQSPFYLVQVWVWERFKNLQPQPKLIKKGDHILLRWHLVNALKIDNVRLALDSGIDDFLWRPYVQYADNCVGVFYPNDEILVPFKKDLDKEMLSFVICMRVSEIVGFDSIEKYLPHRVAMQFGMDQDIPGYVPRSNETKDIAWKNYCKPISDENLHFPSRFFKADVTTRYAKWWKRSESSLSKCRPHAEIPPKLVDTFTFEKSCDDGSKTRKGDDNIDDDVPSGFIPEYLITIPSDISVQVDLEAEKNVDVDYPLISGATPISGKSCDDCSKTSTSNVDNFDADFPSEKSVCDCLKDDEKIDIDASNSSLPPKQNTLTPLISKCIPHAENPPKLVATFTFGKPCDFGSKTRKRDDSIDADAPSGFVPKVLKTIPSDNSVQDGLESEKNIDVDAPSSSLPPKHMSLTPFTSVENCEPILVECKQLFNQFSSEDYKNFKKILALKMPVAKDNVELSTEVSEDGFKDANESNEERQSSDIICKSRTDQDESDVNVTELERRISQLERVHIELKMARLKL